MESQLEISKGYIVVFDNYNFMLKKDTGWERKEKNGKTRPIYKTIGYYSTFDSLLNSYIDSCVRDHAEVSDNINELLNRIEELRAEISDSAFKVNIRDFLGESQVDFDKLEVANEN